MRKADIRKQKRVIIVAIVVVIGLSLYLIFLLQKNKYGEFAQPATKSDAPIAYTHFSQLDGAGVLTAAEETPQVVGVMIDNHPDARPQSGLASARVVYEVPVEGEFTRYFALFNASTTVAEVGPVRSARPYFIDWLGEYGTALYMHSGGSPDALQKIKDVGIFDANEFFWGRYYWRSDDRVAPHNLYTNNLRWQELLLNVGRQPASWQGWSFANNGELVTTSSEPVQTVTIKYSRNYNVQWKFNGKTKQYERYVNGAPDLDKVGTQITATNILVQTVAMQTIDEEGRKDITTIGSGEARVLEAGRLVRGKWKKEAGKRTRFYDQSGTEALLQPGITWVEVVPVNAAIEVGN